MFLCSTVDAGDDEDGWNRRSLSEGMKMAGFDEDGCSYFS